MSGTIKYTSSECGACGPANAVQASCVREFGDEWTNVGYGNCGECKFNCVGSLCTTGARAKCQHIAYLGDPVACCLGNSPGAKRTCDPKYTPGSGLCDSAFANYCVGGAIMNDTKCINWANQRPDAAKQLITAYCTSTAGMDDPKCRTWCKTAGGVCDTAAVNWCKLHPADPYCACIMSPLSDPKYGVNPKCFDKNCVAGGYMTTSMLAASCPNIVNCDVQAQLLNSGVSLSGLTINQNCGSADSVVGAATSSVTTPTAAGSPSPLSVFSSTEIFIIILLFVVLAAVLTWLVFRWWQARKNPRE